jgi:putative endonuclease
MYHVYVIQSKNDLIYTGQTKNLADRVRQHNKGRSQWTSQDIDWRVIYSKSFGTRSDALQYERWLKSGAGRDFVKNNVLSKHGGVAQSVRATES